MGSEYPAAHLVQTPAFCMQGIGGLLSTQGLSMYVPYVPNVPYVLCGSGCQGMFVSDAHFTFETGIQVLGCYQHIMCAGTGLGWDRVNFLHSIWYDAMFWIHD